MRSGSNGETGGRRQSPFFSSTSSVSQRTSNARPASSASAPSSSSVSALNPFTKQSRYAALDRDGDEAGFRSSNPFAEDEDPPHDDHKNNNTPNRENTSYNPFVNSHNTNNPFADEVEEGGRREGDHRVGLSLSNPPVAEAVLPSLSSNGSATTNIRRNDSKPITVSANPPPRPQKQYSSSTYSQPPPSHPPPSHPPPPSPSPPVLVREVEMTSSPNKSSHDRSSSRTSGENLDRERLRTERSRNSLRKHLHKIESKFDKHSGDGTRQCCVDKNDENAVIRFLVKKRAFGYPDTDGSLFSNYLQYVYNSHPFLSVFLLNPLNPYGRKERIIVFFNSLFFAIFVSFIVIQTTYIPKLSTCRMGCNRELVASNSSSTAFTTTSNSTMLYSDECVGGYNDGISYHDYHKVCEHYQPWMLSAISGAFIVLYQSFMEFFATCGCMQGRNFFQNNCIGYRCKSCAEWFGGWMLFFFSSFSLILLIWAVIACYLRGADYDIFVNIILSKVWSAGEWFIWSGPYFSYRYPSDKRRFYKKIERREQQNSQQANNPPPRPTDNEV